MARGQSDYGKYAPTEALSGMADLAELAVRLGSYVIFDRRGKVIDYDNFQGVAQAWTTVKGILSDATAIFDILNPGIGDQCIKLNIPAEGDSPIALLRGIAPLPSERIGVEVAFAEPDLTGTLSISLRKYDGEAREEANLYINFATNTLYSGAGIAPDDFVMVVAPFHQVRRIYHPLKFVVDFETGKFVRLIFRATEYDLSAYSVDSSGDDTAPHVEVRLGFSWLSGADIGVSFTNYILTMDEP